MLTSEQFNRTQRLALSLAGIELVERHRGLLHRRSQRLGIRDDRELDSLLDAAEVGESAATQQLLGLLTTKFTGFFRHPQHFDLAAQHAFRVAGQRGRARLWSAGTATGEEAWSLAMVLSEAFRADDPAATILATDVATDALTVAQRGEYGEASLSLLSPARRERFFQKNCVVPPVRRQVEFRFLNLAREDWPVAGPFDVIFCRNVLMYLDANYRYAVLERMASVLAPDGLLILDPTEHLGKADHLFAPGTNGVYANRSSSRRRSDRLSVDRTAV